MKRVLAALSCLFAALTPVPAAVAGDIAAGRELAGTHCTRCHIVGDLNTMSIGSTPSFQIMVKSDRNFEETFRSFYARRPHPAFVRIEGIPPLTDLPSPIAPIHLTLTQVEDIASFAATLKTD